MEKIVEHIYNKQRDDIVNGRHVIPPTDWTNVIDQEEEWILENCPYLYIIEKASDDLQKKISKINIDKDIITNIIQKIGSSEVGHDAIRVVSHNKDFQHLGHTTGPHAGLDVTASDYNSNINKLADAMHKAIVDDPTADRIQYNKTFLILLSLSFGNGQGGHFGLVLGELDRANREIKVSVLDPYSYYTATFVFLVRQAFTELQLYVYNPGTTKAERGIAGRSAFNGYTLTVENPINTYYLESGSRDPTQIGTLPRNPSDEYAIQSYWGQDHFCFMWCVFFAHNYIVNKSISRCRTLYNEITLDQNINLVIIKTYILQLFNNLGMNVGSLFRGFFKYIWTCYTQKGQSPQPPAIQITNALSVYPNFEPYEISYTEDPAFLDNPTVAGLRINGLIPAVNLPVIQLSLGGTNITFSNHPANKRIILNNIPPKIVLDQQLSDRNSVFQLLYYYYNKEPRFLDVDLIYQKYTNPQGEFKQIDCMRASPAEIQEQITTLNLGPKMGPMRRTTSTADRCDLANRAIQARNDIFTPQMSSINCNYLGQKTQLYDYQERAVYQMLLKSAPPLPGTPRLPGLLLWFGTGTGKTLTANTVAKITTACHQYFTKCFIISTKSVYKSFANSLSDLSDLTPDQLLPEPFFNTDQDSAYFARHNTSPNLNDIYVFSSTRFQSIFMDDNTGQVKTDLITTLNNSLIILDEAHKVVNIENEVEGDYRFFSSCCIHAKQVMLLTATPMVNSASDIEPLLALLDRRVPIPKREFKRMFIGEITVTSNVDDICLVPPPGAPDTIITDCVFNLITNYSVPPQYEWNSTEGQRHLATRIVHKMPVGALPNYKERKLCVSTTDPDLLRALRNRSPMELDNITTNTVSAFGSKEVKTKRYIDIKCDKILEIIIRRENTPRADLIDTQFGVPVFDPYNIRFKYVIYSQSLNFLKNLKIKFSTANIPVAVISEITGNTKDRQKAIDGYNAGKIKILLITDAATEGVDLRRTGMVILAEPVWTKAKYDQIIGRGVRDSSGLRLKPADRQKVLDVLNRKQLEFINQHPSNIGRITTDFTAITTALRDFEQNNIIIMDGLLKSSLNMFGPYITDMLDFSEIPVTIDCMTFVLSYYLDIGLNRKYSIDTYKYNAMRVKYNEMLAFFNRTLSRVIIS
jgi:superfamily II DNA or RNA helicase